MSTPERVACATLLTTESYVEGALVLGYSLRQNGWRGEMLMLVTSAIGENARQRLSALWPCIVETAPIANPIPSPQLKRPEFETTFTKLRIWEQDEYSKLIFLDSDILVMGDLNDLMEYTRDTDFAAAPCISIMDEFNSGVMVLKPSQALAQHMISQIPQLGSHDSSDQGFLNAYFPDWYFGPAAVRLPMKYNVPQFSYIYGNWNTMRPDMRAIHFAGPKPWKMRSPLARKLARRALQRYTQAPRNSLSPLELWWQAHSSLNTPR